MLFAKLWSVYPRLFRWPLADDALHAIERQSLLPLVGGSLFMLVTGAANIDLWYPWPFLFPAGHDAASFAVIGSLLIHLVAKWSIARHALGRRIEPTASAVARRRFLTGVGGVSAAMVLVKWLVVT